MYSDIFCRVYNELGWNYYPEAFGQQMLQWLEHQNFHPRTALDLGCGTGVLCELLDASGIQASGMDLSGGMIAIARERSPHISYAVADMLTFRPEKRFDLVTCTGDAFNHIDDLKDLGTIFRNIHDYLTPGGLLVFDLLNEQEISDSEPFEFPFTEELSVWFQMLRPEENRVELNIRVFENGALDVEETIRETLHDPAAVCALLEQAGLRVLRLAHSLEEGQNEATTWFIIAKKEE